MIRTELRKSYLLSTECGEGGDRTRDPCFAWGCCGVLYKTRMIIALPTELLLQGGWKGEESNAPLPV